MRLIVRRSPLETPIVDTVDAHTVELRDEAGRLQALLFFPPGLDTFLYSGSTDERKPRTVFGARNDPGFEAFARGLGFEMQETKKP